MERKQIEDVFDFLSDTQVIGHEAALVQYYELVRHLRDSLLGVRLIISEHRYLRLIDSACIRYIEVRKRIITIHTDRDIYETYASLSETEMRLGTIGFLRVHRYYLVSCRHIILMGKQDLVLDTGHKIPVGRAYRQNIQNFLDSGSNIRI